MAGIEVRAWPERWEAEPRDLITHATPLLIRLENNGSEPILVRYELFDLRNPVGDDFPAMPPYDLDGTVTEAVTVHRYPLTGFRVAPHLRRWYPGMLAYEDPFMLNRPFWSRHHTVWREIQLPTADMIQMALPEGVLEPGGVASGYVYFERVTEQPSEVTLDFRLVTPDDRELGSVRIPFTVELTEF